MSFIVEPLEFTTELALAELMFFFWLEKRNRWWLRLAVTLAVLLLASLCWPAPWDGTVKIIKYFLVYAISVVGMWSIFCISFWEALYRSAAAYAAQHLAFQAVYLFGSVIYTLLGVRSELLWQASGLVFYLLVYCIVYLCFARRIRRDGLYGLDNRFLSCFVLIMLFLVLVLNYMRMLYLPLEDRYTYLITSLYAIIGCVFALFIQAGLFQHSQLEQKLDITEHLLHSRQEQLKISEETIQCINLKCHDLKHQLSALRQRTYAPNSQVALEEIESAVLIYDSIVKTGNRALDVILTEKSLICEKNHIRLTCMVDGTGLASIRETDLYSIFGNILDNAMESVLKLPDSELRTIGLTVRQTGNMLLMHTENYFDHPVTMVNGLPATTKEDARFHGFGMESVQLLAKRYNGTLSVVIDGHIFNVNIMIPVP